MAELRVTHFNDDLMARLKSMAALDRLSIREYIEKIVAADALRRRKGERVK